MNGSIALDYARKRVGVSNRRAQGSGWPPAHSHKRHQLPVATDLPGWQQVRVESRSRRCRTGVRYNEAWQNSKRGRQMTTATTEPKQRDKPRRTAFISAPLSTNTSGIRAGWTGQRSGHRLVVRGAGALDQKPTFHRASDAYPCQRGADQNGPPASADDEGGNRRLGTPCLPACRFRRVEGGKRAANPAHIHREPFGVDASEELW